MKKHLVRFLIGLLAVVIVFLIDLIFAALVTAIAAGFFWVFTMGGSLPREAGIWIFLINLILPCILIVYAIGAAIQGKEGKKESTNG